MTCCRCQSPNTFPLDTIHPNDHTVYRCRNCGLLFSPNHQPLQPGAAAIRPTQSPKGRAWRPAPNGQE